jgi:cold shock CspA family protein
MNDDRREGQIVFWSYSKKYGFVRPVDAGERDIFVHKSEIRSSPASQRQGKQNAPQL